MSQKIKEFVSSDGNILVFKSEIASLDPKDYVNPDTKQSQHVAELLYKINENICQLCQQMKI